MDDNVNMENYNQVQLFCTKDPSKIQRNAIESGSKSTLLKHSSATNRVIVRDIASWDARTGAHCTDAEGAPCWHSVLQLEHHHQPQRRRLEKIVASN
jgi:hypothetical protein